jgi:hypothetical protein
MRTRAPLRSSRVRHREFADRRALDEGSPTGGNDEEAAGLAVIGGKLSKELVRRRRKL